MSNLTSIKEVFARHSRFNVQTGAKIKGDRKVKGMPGWLLERLKEEKELRHEENPFRSVNACFAAFNVPTPKGHWRLCDYELGHIHGIETIYGRKAATNGILVAIVNRVNMTIQIGHLENFVHDNNLPDMEPVVKEPKQSSFAKSLLDFGSFKA